MSGKGERLKMNIGFVSTWFERGAAYVTQAYMEALSDKHNVYVYARAGEKYAKGDEKWDKEFVTWGSRMWGTEVYLHEFSKWIEEKKIDILFFNEQAEIDPILFVKKKYKNIKIGSYIDYYTQKTVDDFQFYDFLICNTLRHYSVFSKHKQCYYVKWGTDINTYNYTKSIDKNYNKVAFFHSCGLSNRKGTDILIETFIEHELYKQSKLIIHTQKDINEIITSNYNDLHKYNIEVINKTVTAPGLYSLGDIYVYPTYLEGLGLTMYEALACGLPVIAPNNAPMNEIINDSIGKLVNIKEYKCRQDAYYWPLCIIDKDDLAKKMKFYIENNDKLDEYKNNARKFVEEELNWKSRHDKIIDIFENSVRFDIDCKVLDKKKEQLQKRKRKVLYKAIIDILPQSIQRSLYKFIIKI